MKKIRIITVFIITALVAISLGIFLIEGKPGIIIEDLAWYDGEVQAAGFDPAKLLPSQKKPIAEHNWTFVKEFQDQDYITPSVEPVFYNRAWSTQRLINTKVDSQIKPEIYLFENLNLYFIMAIFKLPYSYNSNPIDLGMIDIGYSNNFDVSCYYSISYLSGSQEHMLQNGILDLDQDSMVPIRQNSRSGWYYGFPELIYTFTFSLSPTDDNDLDNDMYLGMDLDFYVLIDHYVDSIQLGFNEFKANENYNTYSVLRKSIYYERGE